MSHDIKDAKLPYTAEVPFDPAVSTYSCFISSFGAHEYTNWIDESMSWKETCYIGDWTPLNKFFVKGPAALDFLQSISGFNGKKFDIGQAKHMICTSNKGKVIGEGILMRYGEDEFQFSGGPNAVGWVMYKYYKKKYDAVATVTTDEKFIFQVQGPKAVFVLEKLVRENLREIKFMRFQDIDLCGVKVSFLRQGMSGEIGFELHGPSAKGVEVYNAILEAGREFGIKRLGELAKGVNHVEACYPTPTWDFIPAIFDEDDEDLKGFTAFIGPGAMYFRGDFSRKGGSVDDPVREACFSPVELGWGKALAFDHDFPGCKILEEEIRDPRRKICTLEWNDEDVADVQSSLFRPGETYQFMVLPREYTLVADKVLKEGKMVGVSTSRCYSYFFRKMISLCVIDIDLCKPGTQVEVVWGDRNKKQKTIRATVAPAPYKTDKKRGDLNMLEKHNT